MKLFIIVFEFTLLISKGMKYCFLFIILYLFTSCNNNAIKRKAPVSYINIIQRRLTPAFNNELVFFADLSLSSGSYRFFVIRLKDSTIINQGLCCNGKTGKNGEVLYSNAPGSNCSSRGAYKIGASYTGKFGKAFKLYGLEASNSNAYSRNVVLHSFWGIPRRSYGLPICKSEGCPTVNPEYLEELAKIISASHKPIMLIVE